MIMAATANPRMTSVSGIATRRIARPARSGFSAISPIAAAPMRACAYPVASADSPMASPAPIAIKPVSMATPSEGGLDFPRLVPAERAERSAAADEERTEELHVLQPQRLDHRAERSESQVEGVEEGRDENADPDRSDRAQLVGDVR